MNLPTIADIEILAQQAFKEIPKNMRTAAGGIDFNAFDFSDDGGDGARDGLRYYRPLSWGRIGA